MKKSTHKRLVAWLLTLALVVTLLPGMGMTVLAVEDGGEGNGPPAVEVVEPEDGNSGSDESVEPTPPPEPKSTEEDKTTEDDGDPSGSDYDIEADTQPRGLMRALAAPTATGNYPSASAVSVDGGKYFGLPRKLYFKNGDSADNFTGTSTNYNAWYNPNTGTLTLKNYSGGGISAGGVPRADITVVLIGTNIINGGSITSDMGGDITITSDSGGTLSITHTQTISGSNPAIGIETGFSASNKTGNVTIKGNAKVTINMTHNGTSTYERAYGIYAKQNITISGNASVDITCATPSNTTGGDRCNGLYAAQNVTIDTTGTIKIDVTKAGKDKDNGYSFGIYPMGTATLTKVGEMEVQWRKNGSSGGAFFRGGSFNASTHAVNEDTTNCYASYRKGTPYQVTAGNGKLTGPGVKYPNGSGMFLKGDKVSITPNVKTGKSGEVIPFQKWTSDNVMFDKSATTASNSFTVPAKKVTVIAEHSPFDGKPTFTPTGDLNDRGLLTFNTVVNPYDGNEYFALVKVGEEDTYISFNPNTTSTSPPYEYSYEAASRHSSYYVAPGEYYVAEKLNNWWYLSEKFTVNYVKPHPEISVSYWPDPTVFPSEDEGYAFAQARILTIDNKGTADTGPLTITVEGKNPDAFTVSPSSITNIEAGKSATSTVRPAKGLTAGTYTATLKISGDNVNTLRRNVKFTVYDPSASAAVRGTVKSYGSASEAVTVTLTKQDETGTAFTDTLTGASGSAPYSQTYSFATVPAGTYTLKVEKKGHAPFTKKITVGDSNVTEDVTVYLIGDVNGDGKIDATDMQRIYAHISGENPISISRGDVNGDGKVDATDMQRIYAHISGENPLS